MNRYHARIPWMEIDENVQPLIRVLNRQHVCTLHSCEGHADPPQKDSLGANSKGYLVCCVRNARWFAKVVTAFEETALRMGKIRIEFERKFDFDCASQIAEIRPFETDLREWRSFTYRFYANSSAPPTETTIHLVDNKSFSYKSIKILPLTKKQWSRLTDLIEENIKVRTNP